MESVLIKLLDSKISTGARYEVSIGNFKGMTLVFSDEMAVATEWLIGICPRYALHNQNHRMVVGVSMDDAYLTMFIGKHGIGVSLPELPPQIGNFLQKPSVIFASYDINKKKERLREATGVVVGRVLVLKKTPAPTGLLPVEGPLVPLHFLAAGLMGYLYGVNVDVSVESEMEEIEY
ncbi:hypothetical protein MRB53_027458 [Persea americana]|uniref:Uncharacterized protein n=1 Tax=Persea americana TaxID=3435 RepID=A0ACC2LKY1_PERAE|nr:hypothetical protein MRB53_027458 [Persea americana]